MVALELVSPLGLSKAAFWIVWKRAWFALAAGFVPFLGAVDWPQYRGPQQDSSTSDSLRFNWATESPRQLWKKTFTAGWSSLSSAGGRVFTQDRRRILGSNREVCVALDAATGQELWAANLDQANYPDGGTEGNPDGPRSTPSVDGDRVYVLTSYLKLYCLEAATGKVVWVKDYVTEFGSGVIGYQNCASPLVAGDHVYLNANAGTQRLLAVRKSDGALAWRRVDAGNTHATPLFATLEGVPQVIYFTRPGLYGLDPVTGNQLWFFAFTQNSVSTAASPVLADGRVYASASYGTGTRMVRLTKNGAAFSAAQVWRATGTVVNHWSTPVYFEGHLYGIYGAANNGKETTTFRCLDAATGSTLWSSTFDESQVGRGGLIRVGNRLLVLTEDGDLVVVVPNPSQYEEVARLHVLEGACWNHPIVSGGRIYARSCTQVVALDAAAAVVTPPLLELDWSLNPAGDQFVLSIANQDQSPINAARAARIEVLASPDIARPINAWNALAPGPTLQGGRLVLTLPVGVAPAWFQARELP